MVLALILCGLLPSAPQPRSQFPALPMNVQKTIDELTKLIDERATAKDNSAAAIQRRREKFLALLVQLDRQVDKGLLRKVKASSESRLEKNLILMSRDSVQNPDHTKEITSFARLSLRASQPQWMLVPKLSAASYRKAHESFLIMPMPSLGFGYDPLRFLGKLHDNESLPVIIREFRLTTGKADPSVFDYQQRILKVLLDNFQDSHGLKAILKCLSLYEAGAKEKVVPPKGKPEHRAFVETVLTATPKWRKVVKSFPIKDVSEKDRKMLQQVLRKSQAGKDKKPKS